MAHKHSVYDSDTHFQINGTTRTIQNASSKKTMLVQFDHDSERFTFEVPRVIEGHDMSECDSVQVHYINIDAKTKVESKGVYNVTDMQISPEGDDVVIFSWLISQKATQYIGKLNFLIRFSCYDEGKLSYAWHTAPYGGISVSDGIYNGEAVAEEYADILNEWQRELEANQVISMVQTQVGDGDGGTNIITATFGDGRTVDFEIKNGSRGDTGLIGSIETINGEPLYFFIGTKEQYEALSDAIKADHLFAIITDDNWLADGIVPIEHGGTGATDALSATQNLGFNDGTNVNYDIRDATTHHAWIQAIQQYALDNVVPGSKTPFCFTVDHDASYIENGLKYPASAIAWSTGNEGAIHLMVTCHEFDQEIMDESIWHYFYDTRNDGWREVYSTVKKVAWDDPETWHTKLPFSVDQYGHVCPGYYYIDVRLKEEPYTRYVAGMVYFDGYAPLEYTLGVVDRYGTDYALTLKIAKDGTLSVEERTVAGMNNTRTIGCEFGITRLSRDGDKLWSI